MAVGCASLLSMGAGSVMVLAVAISAVLFKKKSK